MIDALGESDLTMSMFTSKDDLISALRAENERLREALQDAINHLWEHEPYPKPCYQRCREAYLETKGTGNETN